MINLQRQGDVYVLDLGDGDNRFDGETVPALIAALDEVASTAAAGGPLALVTTATGKIWSNGLDLDHLGSLGDGWLGFIAEVESVYARLLRLPVISVAAIQGHAFAGGAMLALAHDVRLMRSDRGYLCLPEVDLGMPFTQGMSALNAAKLPQPALQRMLVQGERFTAEQAVDLGVADAAVEGEQQVRDAGMALAAELAAKAKPIVATIRAGIYGPAIAALEHS
jgi:enoyl-CoA hydratase/carnithine racemase